MPITLPPGLGNLLAPAAIHVSNLFPSSNLRVLGTYLDIRGFGLGSPSAGQFLRGVGSSFTRTATSAAYARGEAFLASKSGLGTRLQQTAQNLGVQSRIGELTDKGFSSLFPSPEAEDIANPEAGAAQLITPIHTEPDPLKFSYQNDAQDDDIEFVFPYGAQISLSGTTGITRTPTTAKYDKRTDPTIKERTKNTDAIFNIVAMLDAGPQSKISDFIADFIFAGQSLDVQNFKLNDTFRVTKLVVLSYSFPHNEDVSKQPIILQCASDKILNYPFVPPEIEDFTEPTFFASSPSPSLSVPLDESIYTLQLSDIESTA